VSAFPNVANFRLERAESRSEPRVGFRLSSGNLAALITGAFSLSREERVVLQFASNQSSDIGWLVMSLEHCRSVRKELISIE